MDGINLALMEFSGFRAEGLTCWIFDKMAIILRWIFSDAYLLIKMFEFCNHETIRHHKATMSLFFNYYTVPHSKVSGVYIKPMSLIHFLLHFWCTYFAPISLYRSVPLLLMPWLHVLPGHQQLWCYPCRIHVYMFSAVEACNYISMG